MLAETSLKRTAQPRCFPLPYLRKGEKQRTPEASLGASSEPANLTGGIADMTQEDKKPEAADPVARIATALERIADALEQFDPGAFNVLADTLNDCLGETMVGNHFIRAIDLDRE